MIKSVKIEASLVAKLKKLREQKKIGTMTNFIYQAIIEKLKKEKL